MLAKPQHFGRYVGEADGDAVLMHVYCTMLFPMIHIKVDDDSSFQILDWNSRGLNKFYHMLEQGNKQVIVKCHVCIYIFCHKWMKRVALFEFFAKFQLFLITLLKRVLFILIYKSKKNQVKSLNDASVVSVSTYTSGIN